MGLALIVPTYPYMRFRLKRLSEEDRKLYFRRCIEDGEPFAFNVWLARRMILDGLIDPTAHPLVLADGYYECWLGCVTHPKLAQLLVQHGALANDPVALGCHPEGTPVGDWLRAQK